MEVRRSRAFLKQYPLMSEESRERYSAEYTERKLLLKRLSGLETQMDALESLALKMCLDGKPLDLTGLGMAAMYSLWSEQQSHLIEDLRRCVNDFEIGNFLKNLRDSNGFAKTEISNLLGVSARTYKRYEEGKSKMPVSLWLFFLEIVIGNAERVAFFQRKRFKKVIKTL